MPLLLRPDERLIVSEGAWATDSEGADAEVR